MSVDFLVLCGLSGAGGSAAADNLEDLGWFVIDNVPPALITKVGELATAPGSTFDKVALVVRIGRDGSQEIETAITDLSQVARTIRVIFLDAPTTVLIRRYEATRRRHPLSKEGGEIAAAIAQERVILEPLKAIADVIIDTGDMHIYQLRDRLKELFSGETSMSLAVSMVTFGFKHGLPLDVDMVLDCRFLPNPYWVDELRSLTGLDEAVRAYVLTQPAAQEFLHHVDGLLQTVLGASAREGRTYISLAIGCTGGHHRSVAIAGAIAELLAAQGYQPSLTHRDIAR